MIHRQLFGLGSTIGAAPLIGGNDGLPLRGGEGCYNAFTSTVACALGMIILWVLFATRILSGVVFLPVRNPIFLAVGSDSLIMCGAILFRICSCLLSVFCAIKAVFCQGYCSVSSIPSSVAGSFQSRGKILVFSNHNQKPPATGSPLLHDEPVVDGLPPL